MAIQAQIGTGFVFGGCQDLFTENAFEFNNQLNSKPVIDDRQFSISQIVSAQIENQKIQIDHYLSSQNERLRRELQEQRKQQAAALMRRYGSKIQSVMREKEEEIARVARKNVELEECARRMEMERQAWQRLAQEKEATAASLSATIERVREAAALSGAAVDAESSCEEREETWWRETRKMVCRCCNSRESCVIMLPCRHLCSCRDCDAFLDCCPVCNLSKKASLEALL